MHWWNPEVEGDREKKIDNLHEGIHHDVDTEET